MGQVIQSKVLLGFFVATSVLLAAQFANAQARFGPPGYAGTGCPAAQAPKLSFSKGILSIQFNEFKLDDASGKRIDRKACNLRIPLELDPGYQVILKRPEYRGVVRVPAGQQLIIDADATIVGEGRIQLNDQINTATGTRSIKLVDTENQVLASKCGEDAMLGVGASIRYIKGENAVRGVRAQARSMQFQVTIQKCN